MPSLMHGLTQPHRPKKSREAHSDEVLLAITRFLWTRLSPACQQLSLGFCGEFSAWTGAESASSLEYDS